MKNMKQTRSMFKGLMLSALMLFMGTTYSFGQAGVISAPTNIVVTPNNTSVSFNFTVGTVTNTTLDRVEYSIGNTGTWTATTSSDVLNATTSGTFTATVDNLQTGTTYTMNIRVVGTSTTTISDATSFQFTTTTLTAPTALVFTPSWKQLSLAFTPPTSDGGNGITGYKYRTSTDGGTTWGVWTATTGIASPVVLTSLTNGQAYTLQLRAVNAKGDGVVSTNVVGTPIAVANEPTITSINRFNNSLSVLYTAPTVTLNNDFTGAVPVTNYQYSIDNGVTWVTRTPTSSASPLLIENLTMNTTYQVRLRAINAVGNGVSSTATEVTTHNLTAPTGLVLTPGNGQLTVGVTAPTTTSFGALTNYQYKVDDLDWVATANASNTFTITGLTNGVTYSVKVRAVNGGGVGAESAAVTGVPMGTDVARIQFIHNNASVGSVDVFAKGTKINNDLEFRKATAFLTVDAGSSTAISVTTADNVTTLGTLTHTFDVNKNYVVIVQGGSNSKPFELKLVENARVVSSNATAVQYFFSHGISNVEKLNIERVTTSTPRNLEQLVGVGVEYGSVTGYQSFNSPGITTFQLKEGGVVFGQFMFDFGSFDGRTVTLVGTGVKNGEGVNALNILGFDVNGNVVTPKVTTSDTNETVEIPTEFTIYGNYPNPFNPTTNIRFDLPVNANVRVEIVDLLGRNVMTVSPMAMTAGSNKIITVDAARLSSGVYFYKLIAEGSNNTFVKSSKFTLLK
jgi:hypothetical protein